LASFASAAYREVDIEPGRIRFGLQAMQRNLDQYRKIPAVAARLLETAPARNSTSMAKPELRNGFEQRQFKGFQARGARFRR